MDGDAEGTADGERLGASDGAVLGGTDADGDELGLLVG